MTQTDTQLIDELLDFLGVHDRQALRHWMDNVSFGYEYDVMNMVPHEESGRLRLETEEEKEEKRRRARERHEEMQRRYDAGDRSMDILIWRTTQSYVQKLSDNLFTAKPLLFQLVENNE